MIPARTGIGPGLGACPPGRHSLELTDKEPRS